MRLGTLFFLLHYNLWTRQKVKVKLRRYCWCDFVLKLGFTANEKFCIFSRKWMKREMQKRSNISRKKILRKIFSWKFRISRKYFRKNQVLKLYFVFSDEFSQKCCLFCNSELFHEIFAKRFFHFTANPVPK